jgi:hypothetical protein
MLVYYVTSRLYTVKRVFSKFLSQKSVSVVDSFERKILRIIFGLTQVKGVWGIRNNVEINTLYDNVVPSTFLRQRRLRWASHAVMAANSFIA